MSPLTGSIPDRAPVGFKVGPGAIGDITVTLWGDLGLGWFGRLTTALARRGINIQSAQAAQTAHHDWAAALELMTARATMDPHSLDFLELCREPSMTRHMEPVLERWQLERLSTGALQLRFSAADQLGLLSGLFERLEFLSLFPERLRVSTTSGRVEDTLWLKAVAGNAPSTQAESALRALLGRLTRPSDDPESHRG